jgi:Ca2+:H+ antiporter
MLFIAAFGLMVPSAVAAADAQVVPQSLSLVISIILISVYALGLIFTLGTHRKFFAAAAGHGSEGHAWPVHWLSGRCW